MNHSSIHLSSEEFAIFSDPVFFQRKANITKTVIGILEKLHERLENDVQLQQLISAFKIPDIKGKISRGENYLGAPWQVLDYPRIFHQQNVFALRTMCWWGHCYGCTIHLGGIYFEQIKNQLHKNLFLLKNKNAFICVNNKPWEYHYEKENYCLLDEVLTDGDRLKNILNEKSFFKLSFMFPLDQIQYLEKNTVESLNLFSKVLM